MATYVDIPERRAAEAQIQLMALHDALTNLPNRRLFYARLQEALAHELVHLELGVETLAVVHCAVLEVHRHPVAGPPGSRARSSPPARRRRRGDRPAAT